MLNIITCKAINDYHCDDNTKHRRNKAFHQRDSRQKKL